MVRGRRSIGALACLCAVLAGCGGHDDKAGSLESALVAKDVGGLFSPSGLAGVRAPACTASATLPDDFDCTARPLYRPCTPKTKGPCDSPLAPTRVWMQCVPSQASGPRWSCGLVDAPSGTPVFTTPAQKAAPKHGIWECRSLNVDQVQIGPFLLATNDPHGPTEQKGGYMTLDAARAMAARLHLKLTNAC